LKTIIRIRWDRIWRGPHGEDRFPRRLTEEWQRYRRDLFLRYTLPSLWGTCADWCVWLLADRANKRMHQPLDRCEYVYDDAALVQPTERTLLVRMDSDDMLAPIAIRALELSLRRVPSKEFAQLDTGVAWHPASQTLYRWRNPSPPFMVRFVDPGDDIEKSLDFGNHGLMRNQCSVVETMTPTFCVVLHGDNISNSVDSAWIDGDPLMGEDLEMCRGRFPL